MTTQYYTKNVYGKTLIYLIDNEVSRNILAITGQVTISKATIELFKLLSIEFVQVLSPEGGEA